MQHPLAPARGIIAREEVLAPGHCPAKLLHRENEIRAIEKAIKPLLEGRQPDNLFIHGAPGTGKTACVKHVLEALGNARVKPIYVNCWQHSTRMAVYSLIARTIGEMMPRRGLARDEVYDRLIELMEKDGMRVLLILDRMDGLFFRGEEKLLDDLGRAGKLFGIVGISDNSQLIGRCVREVRFSSLEFKPYSKEQMADILAERAMGGLAAGSWEKDSIEACAEMARGDARAGLELLWEAARQAEGAGRGKITIENADSGPKPASLPNSELTLSDEERLILDIVKTGPKTSTDLYLAFFRKRKLSKRQIRNYLDGLEAKRLVHVQTIDGGSPLLNTRLIQLNGRAESA